MSIQSLFNLSPLSNDLVARLGDVLVVATEYNDNGVVDWVARALVDARMLGRLRDRDVANLERLEATYSGNYYNRNAAHSGRELVFA